MKEPHLFMAGRKHTDNSPPAAGIFILFIIPLSDFPSKSLPEISVLQASQQIFGAECVPHMCLPRWQWNSAIIQQISTWHVQAITSELEYMLQSSQMQQQSAISTDSVVIRGLSEICRKMHDFFSFSALFDTTHVLILDMLRSS